MKSLLIRLGLLALMISALVGCGANDGAPGAAGTNGTSGANVVGVATLLATDWLALKPNIDPASITVDLSGGKPVVKFKVTDQFGNPLAGLGGQSLTASNSTNGLPPTNYNIAFTLAKLVPVTGGPSKWVSYLVTTPRATGTAHSVLNGGVTWIGNFPQQEREGAFVDNGDGTYQYTFFRDVTQTSTIVAGLTDTPASGSTPAKLIADLGDTTYDATLTHRLGIIVSGSQPGTGTNTSNAVQVTTAVPMVNTFNIGYDFRPDGGTITTTRDIVTKASCTECHQGRGIGHVTSNSTTATNPTNGVPAGAFIGRNDPRLCVTCHTDQTKYSFAEAVTTATGYDDTSALGYKRVNGEAAFTFPRMIHQTHMGSKLKKTGYNLNAHAKKSDGTTGCDSTSTNAGQCYNMVQYPQDVRNCTKCHDGSTGATNYTTDGKNWMDVPSSMACGACHDGINFTTGAGQRLRDTGTTASGHPSASPRATPDSECSTCHLPDNIVTYHGPLSTTNTRGIPATAAASLRTLSATITAATISSVDGSVTVNFTVTDSAGGSVDYAPAGIPTTGVVGPITAGTSPAGLPFKAMNLTLAKLMPAANGASTYWKSYTGKCVVNNATANPNMVAATASDYHNILQGYSEVQYGQASIAGGTVTVSATAPNGVSAGQPPMAPGVLTSLGGGLWTYKFALVNASTPGDIRTITSAINLNKTNPGLAGEPYNWTHVATCPDADADYDATLTHRIAMTFTTNATPAIDNVTNAYFDFVPSGATAQTRNIVTMASCATCHAGRKIHRGYEVELCVTCHNQNTSDPSDNDPLNTVDLQRIVHKLHYKGTDFWLHGGTFGTGSMTGFPGNVMNCQVCHNENAIKPGTTSTKLENAANWYTTPTSRACGTCHDDAIATAHIENTGTTAGGVQMCTVCHGAGAATGLDAKTVHSKLLP